MRKPNSKRIARRLQKALTAAGFEGKIVKVFTASFGMPYEVGLAKLADGRKAVIKISERYRGHQKTPLAERLNEFRHLRAVAALDDARLPMPLYFKGRTLVMTCISGIPIGKYGNRIKPSAYVELGRLVRRINDMPARALVHATRVKSFTAFFDESVKMLFKKRLVLDLFPREFYERVTSTLRPKMKAAGAFDSGVIWGDANAENIMIAPDGRLAGLIDFADLVVGPRILQFIKLIPTIGEKNLKHFAKGYGLKAFRRNYKPVCVRAIAVLSSLKAVALARKEGDEAWLIRSLKELEERLKGFGLPF